MWRGVGLVVTILASVVVTFSGVEAKDVEIIRPKKGSKISAGGLLVVEVKVADPRLKILLITTPFGVKEVAGPPFRAELLVPAESVGPQQVMVLAKDERMSMMASDATSIDVVPSSRSRLVGLTVEPMSYHFGWRGAKNQIGVTGVYSDGVERNLTEPGTGTRYTSSNPNVVTVERNGIMIARGVGSAQVTVVNGDQQATVVVTVKADPELEKHFGEK